MHWWRPPAHVDDLPIKCEYGGNYPVKLEKKLFAEVEDGDIEMLPHRHRHFLTGWWIVVPI